jgi:heat shock protein HslJ
MHPRLARPLTTLALALALASCAPADPGAPRMPGSVNAPPPPMAAAGDALLTETLWSWKETVMSGNKSITPDAPDRYTLLFQPGGKVSVRADCNRGSASYTLNGGSLSFGPIALTRAMCPSGSKDTEFLAGLAAVSGQLFRGNELTLALKDGSGTMVFTSPRQ